MSCSREHVELLRVAHADETREEETLLRLVISLLGLWDGITQWAPAAAADLEMSDGSKYGLVTGLLLLYHGVLTLESMGLKMRPKMDEPSYFPLSSIVIGIFASSSSSLSSLRKGRGGFVKLRC